MSAGSILDQRSVTEQEYFGLIDLALFEINDLRVTAEYEEDSVEDSLHFIADLEKRVCKLQDAMKDGSYQFVDQNLPFMSLVEGLDLTELPFKYLLRIINATHRNRLRP